MQSRQVTRRLNKIYASEPSRLGPAWLMAQMDALIAAAPGEDRSLTRAEKSGLKNAVVVTSGGCAAVRAALAEKRRRRD